MSSQPTQTPVIDDDVVVAETAIKAVVVDSSDDDDDVELVAEVPKVVVVVPAAAQQPAGTPIDLDPPANTELATVIETQATPTASEPDTHRPPIVPAPEVTIPLVADEVVVTDSSMDVSETVSSVVSAPDVSKNASSLGLLASYGSDGSDGSDEDEDDDDDEPIEVPVTVLPSTGAVSRETHSEATRKLDQFLGEGGDYRVISDSSEEDDSDDDDSDDAASAVAAAAAGGARARVVRSAGGDDDDDDSDVEIVSKSRGFIKAKGELGIDDLPPIEDLKISVPEDECILQGKIFSIVEQLVLVDSLPGNGPLDLETVLFLDKGNTALGRVFDVLGQIAEPLYCVRFNSNEEIVARGLTVGTPVFVAPRTEHTTFVILGNLMREKGCDASWEHDVEPPSRCMEYSDDEEERNARKVRRGKKSATEAAAGDAAEGPSEGSASADGQKRQRNASVSTSEAGSSATENWRQPQEGGRFQRGGGRGARGGGSRGGPRGGGGGGNGGVGRGGFRGQHQPQQHQHSHHQQNQPYGGGSYQQQQQQQQPHQQNWSNPRDNFSWHNNLPYNGGAPQMQHQQQYYAPPPPHMMHPYGVNGAVGGGYAYQPYNNQQQQPLPQQSYRGNPMSQPPQFHAQPPPHALNNQPPPPGYQHPTPPQNQHHQQQQQHQQQQPPHGWQ